MDIVYYLDEKIDLKRKGKYVPVTVKVIREEQNRLDQTYISPLHLLYSFSVLEEKIEKVIPVYIVIFIQHTGTDEATKYFFSEDEARRYISYLARAIGDKQNVFDVKVHYDSGFENLNKLLTNIPLNTYTSFRTNTDTFSVTLAKAI